VPADVVAMSSYSDYWFENLTEAGLSHAGAVDVFRRDIDVNTAVKFAMAGIHTARYMSDLIKVKLNPDLAVRASPDGATPEQWRMQVPLVQKMPP
jgi:hypothetical protein